MALSKCQTRAPQPWTGSGIFVKSEPAKLYFCNKAHLGKLLWPSLVCSSAKSFQGGFFHVVTNTPFAA
jgi:hypothetical protein